MGLVTGLWWGFLARSTYILRSCPHFQGPAPLCSAWQFHAVPCRNRSSRTSSYLRCATLVFQLGASHWDPSADLKTAGKGEDYPIKRQLGNSSQELWQWGKLLYSIKIQKLSKDRQIWTGNTEECSSVSVLAQVDPLLWHGRKKPLGFWLTKQLPFHLLRFVINLGLVCFHKITSYVRAHISSCYSLLQQGTSYRPRLNLDIY